MANWARNHWREESLRKILLVAIISTIFGFVMGKYQGNLQAPKFRNTIQLFQLNDSFIHPPSTHSNHAWSSLIPKGRGFIALDSTGHPISYSGHTPDLSSIRAISVFHQLHCLNELRIGFYSRQADAESGNHHHSNAHMAHCFDYLRQALMCAADTTFEELRHDGDQVLASVNGWGAVHECRDFEDVRGWTERYRATDEGGI